MFEFHWVFPGRGGEVITLVVTAAGFSFRKVSNSSPGCPAPLEDDARNISRTAFSLAGVPAGGAHFKNCQGRKTASGIYLRLLVCTF